MKTTLPGFAFAGEVAFSRVQAAFQRGAIATQRDHVTRAPKAKYIGQQLDGEQFIFHAIMVDGQEMLLDGYTRVERISRGLTDEPEKVFLFVHNEAPTQAALMARYDQFNNPAAAKKSADRFAEGLRLTEQLNSLQSNLVIRGPKSAPKCASHEKDLRLAIMAVKEGMQFVDNLGLDKTHETVGLLAAYYAVGQHTPEKLQVHADEFIRKMNQRVFSPSQLSYSNQAIIDFRKYYWDKRNNGSVTGGSNVASIRDNCLTAYLDYLDGNNVPATSHAAKTVSLGSFVAIMDELKARLAA